MDLSIIIVTWNGRSFVAECLQSLAAQDAARGPEIIVVDNASTDGTPDMIARDYPGVHLVRNSENLGFARANNIGIARATRKYVLLVNSDVNVLPGCLESLSAFLDQHADVGLVGPQMLGRDLKVRRSSMRFPTLWNAFCRSIAIDRLLSRSRLSGGFLVTDFGHDRTQDVDVLNGWFWAARRDALREVGMLDERFFMYAEDVDWCYRFHLAGWRVVFFPEAKAIHYGGSSSANAPVRFYVERQKANLQFWQKYHTGYPRLAFTAMMMFSEMLRIIGYGAVWLVPSQRHKAKHKIHRSAACMRWIALSAFGSRLSETSLQAA